MGRGDPDESLFAICVEIRDSGSGERHDCGGPPCWPDGGQKRGGETPSVRFESTGARNRSGRDHRSDRPARELHKVRNGSGAEPKSPQPRANPYASVWTWSSACDKVQSGDARGPPFQPLSDSTLGQKESNRCLFPLRSSTPRAHKSTFAAEPSAPLATNYVRLEISWDTKKSHPFGESTISEINAGKSH